jgi:hypothetical protein
MHSEYAMTTAQTRISGQPLGLAAAFALILIVVIAILPL